ncbi:hypothetical protein J4E83_009149 [Alternaria metachromatica]|uniref:uncharacterized protein n=1 Tax=Alternaria metachromatica TaxID=283354 RepID=UPI0020C1F8F2|nr:uncharacterized protein J4E83_009149 [Alternaria metachromatica]KAI4608347.1 hypothetical protein J4E83_009149 [Alternaria metachromatica]
MHPLTLFPLIITFATALPFAASPNPDPSNQDQPDCAPGAEGTTAGVTYCLSTNFNGPCEWHAYYPDRDLCMAFDEKPERRPLSIRPQHGGYCELFKDNKCGGDPVSIWKDDTTTKLECPGMSDAGKPDWFGSMRCRTENEGTENEGTENSDGSSGGEYQGSGGYPYPGRDSRRSV